MWPFCPFSILPTSHIITHHFMSIYTCGLQNGHWAPDQYYILSNYPQYINNYPKNPAPQEPKKRNYRDSSPICGSNNPFCGSNRQFYALLPTYFPSHTYQIFGLSQPNQHQPAPTPKKPPHPQQPGKRNYRYSSPICVSNNPLCVSNR